MTPFECSLGYLTTGIVKPATHSSVIWAVLGCVLTSKQRTRTEMQPRGRYLKSSNTSKFTDIQRYQGSVHARSNQRQTSLVPPSFITVYFYTPIMIVGEYQVNNPIMAEFCTNGKCKSDHKINFKNQNCIAPFPRHKLDYISVTEPFLKTEHKLKKYGLIMVLRRHNHMVLHLLNKTANLELRVKVGIWMDIVMKLIDTLCVLDNKKKCYIPNITIQIAFNYNQYLCQDIRIIYFTKHRCIYFYMLHNIKASSMCNHFRSPLQYSEYITFLEAGAWILVVKTITACKVFLILSQRFVFHLFLLPQDSL